MAKKDKSTNEMRWFWAVIVLLIGVAGTGLSGCGETEKQPPTGQTETQIPSPIPGSSETLEGDPAETTPEPTETPAPAPSDLEIVTREGHPTYYGSVELSHAIWDDVEKGKIIFADSSDRLVDKPILSMNAYRNSDLIRGIHVSFFNFDEPVEATIDDILPVIASYIPYDVMDEYYQFRQSYSIMPDDGKENTDNYYVITYGLTDEAKETYGKGHEYSGSIDVVIRTLDNGQVADFDIGFGTPRWMSSLGINSMHEMPWSCDLMDYRGT